MFYLKSKTKVFLSILVFLGISIFNLNVYTFDVITGNQSTVYAKSEKGNITVDEVRSYDRVITGTGESGALAILKLPNGIVLTAEIDQNGNWDVHLPEDAVLNADDILTISLGDSSGNTIYSISTSVLKADEESKSANDFTIDTIRDNDKVVTGTGEPGRTVEVHLPNGKEVSSTVGTNGNWAADIPEDTTLNSGESLTVNVKDSTGNVVGNASAQVSTSTNNENPAADTTPPGKVNVDPIVSNDRIITGTGEPNATVTVKFGDGSEINTIVGSNGNWMINVPEGRVLSPRETLVITQKDAAGNISEGSNISIEQGSNPDLEPPSKVEVNEVKSTDKVITGTGEPGAVVTLTLPNGNTLTANVGEDGRWSINIPAEIIMNEGESLTLSQKDGAGNISEVNSITVLKGEEIDITPPEKAVINTVKNTDRVVTGTGEPGATITLTLPNGSSVTGIVAEDGKWSIDIPSEVTLNIGETLGVSQIDRAGNLSESNSASVEEGEPLPAKEVQIDPIKSGDRVVTGSGQEGATITVTLPNGEQISSVVGEDGKWIVNIPSEISLNEGESITLTQTDRDGNVKQYDPVPVQREEDTTAPDKVSVNPVKTTDTEIKGRGEAKATVTIVLPNDSKVSSKVNEDGNWSLSIPEGTNLKAGDILTFTQKDEAGNVSQSVESIVLEGPDTIAPESAVIHPVKTSDTKINGTGEPKATVIVTLPDGYTISTKVGTDGKWEVTIPTETKLSAGAEIGAVQKDEAGNESPKSTINVSKGDEDVTPPDKPIISPVKTSDTKISGTGEPKAIVIVTLPNGYTISTRVGTDGKWSVTIPTETKLRVGEELTVSQKDEAGNESPKSTSTIAQGNEDVTPPEKVVISPVKTTDKTISGTGEPKATAYITLPNGYRISTKVGTDGKWTVNVPAEVSLRTGDTITASQKDEAGNESQTSSVTVTYVDTTAPEKVGINSVKTTDTTISGTGEQKATVIITLPNGSSISTKVGTEGKWSVNIPTGTSLKQGDVLTAKQNDEAGNTSQSSSVTVTYVDTTPPQKVNINSVKTTDTSISGTGEQKATVIVTLPNGYTVSTKVGTDGKWSVGIPTGTNLKQGDILTAKQKDEAGNESQLSSVTVTNADTTPPGSATVNTIKSTDTVISGTGEANATVTVKLPNGSNITATVGNDGKWSVNIPSGSNLKAGDTLTVNQKDGAGNVSPNTTVTVGSSDTTPPGKPTVNSVKRDEKIITGTGEPKATVLITLPNGSMAMGLVDSSGKWSVSIPASINFKVGDILTVSQKDAAGNVSESTSVLVQDAEIINISQLEQGVIDLLNYDRTHGAPGVPAAPPMHPEQPALAPVAPKSALQFDPELYTVAKLRATQIAEEYDHKYKGVSSLKIIREAGYKYLTAENILKVNPTTTAEEIYRLWFQSESHRKIMLGLKNDYNRIAVAIYKDPKTGRYCAVMLVSKR